MHCISIYIGWTCTVKFTHMSFYECMDCLTLLPGNHGECQDFGDNFINV